MEKTPILRGVGMSYNLSQLRVLWEIASDGIVFNNIIAHSETSIGDYQPVNIKTDITEQKWRSSIPNNAFIIFDVGQTFDPVNRPGKAIVVDTAALIDTNLTTNATIKLHAYGDQSSSPVASTYVGARSEYLDMFKARTAKTYTFTRKDDPYESNVLFVSPTEIIQSYRHWCLEINDSRNPDGYVEVGRFVAGQASILTQLENFTDEVTYTEENYKDELKINGFSSISNNRTLKKRMTIRFKSLDMNGDNFRILRRMFRYIRDTKKALVLPDPSDLYRFNLFAKLENMPKMTVNYVDKDTVYVSFDLEWNEGK
jgi:hypothetical protein